MIALYFRQILGHLSSFKAKFPVTLAPVGLASIARAQLYTLSTTN